MNRFLIFIFSGIFLILTVIFFSSCGHTKKATCQSNNYHKSNKIKRSRGSSNQVFTPKYRSVRKNYVIKNGIAN